MTGIGIAALIIVDICRKMIEICFLFTLPGNFKIDFFSSSRLIKYNPIELIIEVAYSLEGASICPFITSPFLSLAKYLYIISPFPT